MGVKTFDPKQVQVIIGGNEIAGFADGEFINIERDENTFSKVVGADGEVSRSKSNNRSGALTLTLLQTSASNDVLSAIMIADELTNSGIIPIFVKDSLGTTNLFAGEGWIQKPPASPFDKEITNREWVIELASVDVFIGGNVSN